MDRALASDNLLPARRIGLLGGSFNPAHSGHRDISLSALKHLGLDVVWWLVTPGNPLKDRASYADYESRLHEARRIASHPDIVVSDFEKRRNLQYTVDTLGQLQDANPDAAFIWLMGADSLSTFHRWRDWQRIAELVPIAVFNRPGCEENALESEAAQALAAFRIDQQAAGDLLTAPPPAWVFITDTSNPISSTQIRQDRQTQAGEKPITETAPDDDLIAPMGPLAFFLDKHPPTGDFRTDVINGLSAETKHLSPKYFYDERGSKLFHQITLQPEYYPTLTERSILLKNAAAICAAPGKHAAIFEYGSGASEKIEWLLNGLDDPSAYVAMDISKDFLIENASIIARKFDLPVAAVCADFYEHVHLPKGILPEPARWLGYFPGSTLGNMTPDEAARFLRRAGETLGDGAQFLLGIDLEKDDTVLNGAYNDAAGITAKFNLNVLRRMQTELDTTLDIDAFEHVAFYNEAAHRIEMHLRARTDTEISLDGVPYPFEKDETMLTEYSHKYSIERLKTLFAETPWRLETVWTDDKGWFAACLLSNN